MIDIVTNGNITQKTKKKKKKTECVDRPLTIASKIRWVSNLMWLFCANINAQAQSQVIPKIGTSFSEAYSRTQMYEHEYAEVIASHYRYKSYPMILH